MRHALLERVDDDVRQLAVHPVGAADAIAELEAYARPPPFAYRSDGDYGRVSRPARIAETVATVADALCAGSPACPFSVSAA